MSTLVKMIVIQPLSDPEIREVESTDVWRVAQKLIDGYIEILYLTAPGPSDHPFEIGWHLAAYVNEGGIICGLPRNRLARTDRGERHLLYGPIVVVRQRIDREGNLHFADPTEDDTALVRSWPPAILFPSSHHD